MRQSILALSLLCLAACGSSSGKADGGTSGGSASASGGGTAGTGGSSGKSSSQGPTCNPACSDSQTCLCLDGSCSCGSLSCPTGETACPSPSGQVCVTLSANAQNCGSCGNACPSGEICQASACAVPASSSSGGGSSAGTSSGGGTSGGSSVGTSSGGSTGGTSGTGSSGGGACQSGSGGLSGVGGNPCTSNADCSCPAQCVSAQGYQMCALSCQQFDSSGTCGNYPGSDVVGWACQSGFCVLSFCAYSPLGPVAGALGSPCTVNDGGGTCNPWDDGDVLPDGGGFFGLCIPNGGQDAGSACANDEIGADLQCGAGLICPEFGNGCASACTKSSDCGTGEICLTAQPFVSSSVAGYCGACLTSGGSCFADADCCASLHCDGGTCG